MNPRTFLELARRLVTTEPNAAGFRCIVGRAYYATFNVASEFMAKLKFPLRGDAADHELIYRWLNNCGDTKLKANADHLNTLRRSRNDADYDMNTPVVETEPAAKTSILLAAKVIEELDSCSADFARLGDVKLAIQEYRRQNSS
jgi:hypothetical protein